MQRLIWIFCIKQVHHRIWKRCKGQRLCLKWIAINTLVKTSVASQSYRNSHAWNDLYIPKYEPSPALFGFWPIKMSWHSNIFPHFFWGKKTKPFATNFWEHLLPFQAMAALNGEYEASYDGKAPKACVEELHFGLWGEDPAAQRSRPGSVSSWVLEIHGRHGGCHRGTPQIHLHRMFPL